MLTLPSDLSSSSDRQLQELQSSAAQEIMQAQGVDFTTAWNRAKLLYPQLWAEKQRRADDGARNNQPPSLCNDADKGRIAQFTPSTENFNRLGLHPSATEDEFNVASKSAGSDLSNPDYDKAFAAVSDLAARARNISSQAADSAVAIRHPNLAKKANMQRVARQLQDSQPDANAGFQKVTPAASPAPSPSTARSMGTGPGPLNTGKSGLGAFQVS